MGELIDLKGKRFGRLTVINQSKKRGNAGQYYWDCLCDCGNKTTVSGVNLRNSNTKSCGCYKKLVAKKSLFKHGKKRHPLYRVWSTMKERCKNPNSKKFKNYGLRGISVCKKWDSDFMNFYNWAMNNGYLKGLSIERIDNNGNYEPKNCKWITMAEQAKNKTTTVRVYYFGKEMTIAELSNKTGLSYDLLYQRIFKLKWSVDDAVKRPHCLGNNQYQNSWRSKRK